MQESKDKQQSNNADFDSGCYLFICKLEQGTAIKPGALREMLFPAGHYIYVGRARKNLKKRVARHFTREKKNRWHIDYLTQHALPCSAMATEYLEECQINQYLNNALSTSIISGFGASDCKCSGHLHLLKKPVSENYLREVFSIISVKLYTITI